jgi:hypothetical protein
MVRFILIALWVCCAGLPALAQQSSFNFRKLDISEGLHDGTIRCVGQDTFGFIWMPMLENRVRISVGSYEANCAVVEYLEGVMVTVSELL